MSQRVAYVPEWACENNPTVTMSDKAMMAHYKANALAGDIRFYLTTQTESLTADEYHALAALAGRLLGAKAGARKQIALDVRAIMTTVGQRKGYVSLREAQMRLGQDMADAIEAATEAA